MALMDLIQIATIYLGNNFGPTSEANLSIIPLRSVYYHRQVSEKHEYIYKVVSIPMGVWSMYFITPIDIIDINTISLEENFGLIPEV